jgi:predicted ABC-type ATPase
VGRIRMFGGPNGSGKSTIFDALTRTEEYFKRSIYINADEIEKLLKTNFSLNLKEFNLNGINNQLFIDYINNHTMYKSSINKGLPIDLSIDNDVILNPNKHTHSYEAAIIADFIRHELLIHKCSFIFETVMSHSSKVDLMRKSMELGNKNYLYFVSTESPEINIDRVRARVAKGGHPVPEDKIVERYYKSMSLLKEVIPYTHKTYIFDNSGKESKFMLTIQDGQYMEFHQDYLSNWIVDCLNI